MKKQILLITIILILVSAIGCGYFRPYTVDSGKDRLAKLVDEYVTECGTIKPFGTEDYDDTQDNLTLAKINEDYLNRARELLKQIEAIDPGERGDELKVLRTNASLFVNILETRADAFSTVDPEMSEIEQGLYSARFAILIGVANDEMSQLQTYLQ